MKFLHRTKKWQNLKKLCESDYYVLNYEQLLLVNGAGTNNNKSTNSNSTSSSNDSREPSGNNVTGNSGVPSATNNNRNGKGGTQQSSPSTTSQNQTPSSTPNPIDNTNHKDIVSIFTNAGYELLSDKQNNMYTAGSRKKYMQSEFETFCSDPDLFKVTKETYAVEGVYDGNHSYNDYDNYVIYGKDGKIIMDAIDVNRDGIIDYVK